MQDSSRHLPSLPRTGCPVGAHHATSQSARKRRRRPGSQRRLYSATCSHRKSRFRLAARPWLDTGWPRPGSRWIPPIRRRSRTTRSTSGG